MPKLRVACARAQIRSGGFQGIINHPFHRLARFEQRSFTVTVPPSSAVGCLEDKPKEWDHPGKYKCKSCRATSDKKSKLCKPAKIEKKKK